jgi:hypothetical protein
MANTRHLSCFARKWLVTIGQSNSPNIENPWLFGLDWRKGCPVNSIENTYVYLMLATKATVSTTAF